MLSYVVPLWITFPPLKFNVGAPLLTWPAVQPFGIAYIVGGATYGLVFGTLRANEISSQS